MKRTALVILSLSTLLLTLTFGSSRARTEAGPSIIEQRAPFDLLWDAVDTNGIPLNPRWASQLHPPHSPFLAAWDAEPLCIHYFGLGAEEFRTPPCTTQPVTFDSGPLCKPITHINWMPATYEGAIFWSDKSGSFSDDDYNMRLYRQDRAGITVNNSGELLYLEFDSDETIDYFKTPWWSKFHQAVDSNLVDYFANRSSVPYARTHALVDGRFAIVTGLIGIDREHRAWVELHPVWAMAIHADDNPADDTWAIFVRNYGNEGWCSHSQYLLNLPNGRFTLRLPWRPNATCVSKGPANFRTNREVIGPEVSFDCNHREQGVLVTFTLPPAIGHYQSDPRVWGELHLSWAVPPTPARFTPCWAERRASPN